MFVLEPISKLTSHVLKNCNVSISHIYVMDSYSINLFRTLFDSPEILNIGRSDIMHYCWMSVKKGFFIRYIRVLNNQGFEELKYYRKIGQSTYVCIFYRQTTCRNFTRKFHHASETKELWVVIAKMFFNIVFAKLSFLPCPVLFTIIF